MSIAPNTNEIRKTDANEDHTNSTEQNFIFFFKLHRKNKKSLKYSLILSSSHDRIAAALCDGCSPYNTQMNVNLFELMDA